MNLVPLVITTLGFPYHGATAPRACVPGRRGYVPRQTPSCPAFFQSTGPYGISVTEKGIWLHTKGNGPAVLCL